MKRLFKVAFVMCTLMTTSAPHDVYVMPYAITCQPNGHKTCFFLVTNTDGINCFHETHDQSVTPEECACRLANKAACEAYTFTQDDLTKSLTVTHENRQIFFVPVEYRSEAWVEKKIGENVLWASASEMYSALHHQSRLDYTSCPIQINRRTLKAHVGLHSYVDDNLATLLCQGQAEIHAQISGCFDLGNPTSLDAISQLYLRPLEAKNENQVKACHKEIDHSTNVSRKNLIALFGAGTLVGILLTLGTLRGKEIVKRVRAQWRSLRGEKVDKSDKKNQDKAKETPKVSDWGSPEITDTSP